MSPSNSTPTRARRRWCRGGHELLAATRPAPSSLACSPRRRACRGATSIGRCKAARPAAGTRVSATVVISGCPSGHSARHQAEAWHAAQADSEAAGAARGAGSKRGCSSERRPVRRDTGPAHSCARSAATSSRPSIGCRAQRSASAAPASTSATRLCTLARVTRTPRSRPYARRCGGASCANATTADACAPRRGRAEPEAARADAYRVALGDVKPPRRRPW